MFGAFGIVGTFAAAAMAQMSLKSQDYTAQWETASGICLIVGLGLLGASLPRLC
jgi:uncharacterized membrane protein YgdD (TMEM256/DUF423 family)